MCWTSKPGDTTWIINPSAGIDRARLQPLKLAIHPMDGQKANMPCWMDEKEALFAAKQICSFISNEFGMEADFKAPTSFHLVR